MRLSQITEAFSVALILLSMLACSSEIDSTQNLIQGETPIIQVQPVSQPAWNNEGEHSVDLLITLKSSRALMKEGESALVSATANNLSRNRLPVNLVLQFGNGLILSSTTSCTGDPCTGFFDVLPGQQALMNVMIQSNGPVAQSYSVILHYNYPDIETGELIKGKVEGLISAADYTAARVPRPDVTVSPAITAVVPTAPILSTREPELSTAVVPTSVIPLSRVPTSTPDVRFVSKWRTKGDGDGQFTYPRGVAVGPDGSVYVADGPNHRIQKFTSDGEFVTNWGTSGSGDGEFEDRPSNVAVAPDGSVYIAQSDSTRIQKFTSDGIFVTELGGIDEHLHSYERTFRRATGVAVAPGGSVYVVDWLKHSVQQFTAEGVLVYEWGTVGQDDGEFDKPYGIAVAPDGSVYVADTSNHRIQKFTDEGAFVTKWGIEGKGDGEFFYPHFVAVAPDGSVYVGTGQWNDQIQRFTPEGVFVSKWRVEGLDEDDEIQGIAVASDGSVYVADTNNGYIHKFSVGQ